MDCSKYFSTIAFLSIITFIFKNKNLSFISKSLAPIGLLFTSLAIITGVYLGKTNLGNLVGLGRETYIDDSFNVILCFIGFFFKLFKKRRNCKILSIISILGMINIPIILNIQSSGGLLYISQLVLNLLSTSSIHPSMLIPLFLMLLVLLLYCALIFLMKYKTEIIKIKKQNIKRL